MSVEPLRHVFTVEEFERMGERGVFPDDARLELLEGEVVEMSPIGSRHAACVNRLNALFGAALRSQAILGVQNPIRLGDLSEPQPDFVLLRPVADFYEAAHPQAEDVLLVVEVSDTTLAVDRDVKRPLYAVAGVVEMWIVDLAGDAIEVATDPQASGYGSVVRHFRGAQVAPSAFLDVTLAVDDILG